MTSNAVSDAQFTDALSGVDGTDDPPPLRWRPETFPDALVAPQADLSDAAASGPLPQIPVPELPAVTTAMPPSPEDWDRDLHLPPVPGVPSGPARGSTAQRAEAARRAAAARRDAAVASRGATGAGRGGTGASRGGTGPGAAASRRGSSTAAVTAVAHHPTARPPAGYPNTVGYPAGSAGAPGWPAPTPNHPTAIAPAALPVPGAAQARPSRPAAHPAPYPPARRPAQRTPGAKKKTGGAWGALVFVILFLVASGAGSKILDGLSDLFNQ